VSARLLVVALVALALAGCGGGTVTTNMTTTAATPPVPQPTAQQLAAEADTVAADLDRGDGCAAREHAARLRTDAIAAINAHLVPGPYQETLLGRVQELEGQIRCVPPAPPAHRERKHKGKHKHSGDE
jgi:hypothetical protein